MNNTFISPLTDSLFTFIFGDQRNIRHTRDFLKTILNIPEEDFGRLTVVNPALKRLFSGGKGGIVDIRINTRSGRILHVEIQRQKTRELKSRIVHYLSRLVAEQLKEGDNYGKLKQVISVIICDHKLLEEEEGYLNVYGLQNRENRRFTNLLEVVILELPKVPEEEDHPVWKWLKFFKCGSEEECDMLAGKYPEIGEAVKTMRKVTFGERWRMTMYHRWLSKIDEENRLAAAQEDGEAAGYNRARQEYEGQAIREKLETARKLKAMGDPVEKISTVTGLSREEVEKV